MTMPAANNLNADEGAPDGKLPAVTGRPRRHKTWAVATAGLVACGVVGSALAAGALGRAEHNKALRSFDESSAGIASNLELAIQHEEDLVVNAGAFLGDKDVRQSSFGRWAAEVRLTERYPELTGIAGLVIVRDADLPDFAAGAVADPAGTLGPGGTFEVVPAGKRPFYCLVAASVATGGVSTTPAGTDYCAIPLVKSLLLEARDSGVGTYLPYDSEGTESLAVQTPIYRGGQVPATVKARREAFVGVVATQLDPEILLDRALQGHPGLAVSMAYDAGDMHATFGSGTLTGPNVDTAESVTIDLENGWTVETFGVVDQGGALQGGALVRLIGGSALSVLLGLLMFVLATGRERARRQLHQRTGQLKYQAFHDALTGLPNRALVMDRIDQMLARDRRHHTVGAVLFVDLDDFKNVNDTLGHGAGDRLLVAVAARLATTLREVDTIGRMGGDEFVVLIDGVSPAMSPELVAQRLLDVMRQPFELGNGAMPLTVNLSIGIATGPPDDGDDVSASGEELLRKADVALYEAKGAGKNRFATFELQHETDIGRRTELEFDLRSALTSNQYRLVYQPIYDLGDLTVIGVEALLRWDHPQRGAIVPDEFIPVLEQTGQIREVGRWVLQQACAQMAAWHARGDTLDISVNVSARQLDDDGITDDIRDALESSGLDASTLMIEITETALMHNLDTTARRLHEIKELGVRVAVDDFGTGYSSLAYLRQFPVDCLKIDRAFTHALSTSPESKALVGALVQLGKDLGLTTLAEGVETAEEMDILRGVDVDQAQGFLMARPLDPATLEEQLLAPTRPVAASHRHPG
jgi:diguanylate cyclase (GGDEF)-like protein